MKVMELMRIKTVGSICSGIEAASVAWKEFDFEFKWFSASTEFSLKNIKGQIS